LSFTFFFQGQLMTLTILFSPAMYLDH
jgi:hypothetical protein